mmetsp:Transcript_8989/g.22783  ORF Transcript_8989/g.22783 Transcript_8989/m.22783 type:complete len:209 (+) Transcript_8989:84-710(+)
MQVAAAMSSSRSSSMRGNRRPTKDPQPGRLDAMVHMGVLVDSLAQDVVRYKAQAEAVPMLMAEVDALRSKTAALQAENARLKKMVDAADVIDVRYDDDEIDNQDETFERVRGCLSVETIEAALERYAGGNSGASVTLSDSQERVAAALVETLTDEHVPPLRVLLGCLREGLTGKNEIADGIRKMDAYVRDVAKVYDSVFPPDADADHL